MSLLVTGGAGYIGAHVVRLAQEAGRGVVVVDDLSSGDRTRVDGATVCRLDVAEPAALTTLTDLMAAHAVTSVVHLAGRKQVAESMARPAWYYQQNVAGLATVLEAMQAADVRELVFSSSAAVYGDPAADVVD
ncbi:MAG: UDP-glucose 4-epimerase, partial [Actinotalea sp.]|nr:UDP-glucose 4-epimerase [Actinotalea sp.]